MESQVLKALLRIAVADTPEAPHTRPIFPNQIIDATGLAEETIERQLTELHAKQLVKFISTDTKIVTLAKSGVQVAKVL